MKTWFQNRRMKHKKVSKKSVNSTTGKTSSNDQVSLSLDGHISRKMKKTDSINSRSNSGSSRSRSNSVSSSRSNNSNIDCESGKSDDEASFNQSMDESYKEREDTESKDFEENLGEEGYENYKKKIHSEFPFNVGLNQSQNDLSQFYNFQTSLSAQQLKMLHQFYNEIRSGNKPMTNAFNSSYMAQLAQMSNFPFINETNSNGLKSNNLGN